MTTLIFSLSILLCVLSLSSKNNLQLALAYSDGTWDIGGVFTLSSVSGYLAITDNTGSNVWSTPPGEAYISAGAGNDSVIGANGNFNITQVDTARCRGQNMTEIRTVPWDEANTQIAVQNLPDRVAFYLDIRDSSDTAHPLKKLYLTYTSTANEDVYGLGAQASFASLKGQSVPILSREQGVGRGDQPVTAIENENGTFAGGNMFTTYTAIASYIRTEGRVFYLSEKSTGYANFDFMRPDTVTVRYDSTSVDGAFLRAGDMFEAVEKLTGYTGRMPPLPKWVEGGAILGIQGGQDKVNRIVQQGLDLDCPIARVWLEDWVGTHTQAGRYINVSRLWWNWENDQELYPSWKTLVQNLRDQHGVRTLSYINPFLTNVSTKASGFRRNLFAEADALGFFVQNTTINGTSIVSCGPGLQAGIIDLTDPELVQWFTHVLRTQVWNANVSGFMSDFGEYTPVSSDTRLTNMVLDAFFFHNQYPYLWAKFQREVADSLGLRDEALIFHRSAAMASNRYMNLFWVGDQNVDWDTNDGIKSVVTIMAHMGLSGYPQQHSDIGGYTDTLTYQGVNITRSAELLGRWGELAAVSSAVFRSHEGNIPSVNAQFYSNKSTYEYYAYNARMFASLAPYRGVILETECETRGWPLLRPPVMYHTEDAKARDVSYQSFYLGPDLYVAPVLDPGVLEVEVYLPGANWSYTHVWTNRTLQGNQTVTIHAPYGKPIVFFVGENTANTLKSRPELQISADFARRENATLFDVL